jgi:hypothetical protein
MNLTRRFDVKKKTEIILLHENLKESIIADTITFGFASALMIAANIIGSTAFEWVAATVWVISVLGHSAAYGRGHRMTTEEARRRLEEIEEAAGSKGV